MGKTATARVPELRTCLVCGGNWFREADFYEFWREEAVGNSWPTWPDLVGKSPGPMGLGICLCGSPWKPLIGGMRGGRTPNRLLNRLVEEPGKGLGCKRLCRHLPRRVQGLGQPRRIRCSSRPGEGSGTRHSPAQTFRPRAPLEFAEAATCRSWPRPLGPCCRGLRVHRSQSEKVRRHGLERHGQRTAI